MKLTEVVNNVEAVSNYTPSTFQIAETRANFELWSKRIYADPIKAIIRELSTNAVDAHFEAGKSETPFEIHLPNHLEPYFSLKDNGTGMSEEKIHTIYKIYGKSDKTHTNDLVGCLGLGSKSPFAYTQVWSVENRYKGTKSAYSCYIEKDGKPNLLQISSNPTDECDGLEVRFGVEKKDFWEFSNKASEALSWFKIRPIVVGRGDFEFKDYDYLLETPNYALSKGHSGDSYVVMGNIAYEVTSDELSGVIENGLSEIEQKILDWGIELRVNIGEVEFTADREKVSYNSLTVATIRRILALAIEDMKKDAEQSIAACTTLWQAKKKLHNYEHTVLNSVRSLIDLKWNGKTLTDNAKFESWKGETKFVGPDPTIQTFTLRRANYRRRSTDRVFADDQVVLYNDIGHGGYVRLHKYIVDRSIDKCYYVGDVPEQFLKDTGLDEVVLRASTLPKPAQKAHSLRQKSEKATLNEYKYPHSSKDAASYWKPAEIDLADGGVYVEISYYRYESGKHPDDMKATLQCLEGMDLLVPIYGIRTSDLKVLAKYKNWVSLKDYVTKILEDKKDLLVQVKAGNDWSNFSDGGAIAGLDGELPKSVFADFVKQVAFGKECYEDGMVSSYKQLASLRGIYSPPVNSLESMFKEMQSRYPLFRNFSWWTASSNKQAFTESLGDYIVMVDTKLSKMEAA